MIKKPCGYFVLIEVEKVEQVSAGGIVIASKHETQREQEGHDIGRIVAFGPLAYCGHKGVDADTPEERAAQWGCKIGDTVEFIRYDGKFDKKLTYRSVTDNQIINVIEESA